jgi:hypothetical protein
MKKKLKSTAALVLMFGGFFNADILAQNLDFIGVTLLRTVTTNVDGSGIRVAQPEANVAMDPIAFEVNPANVGQPGSLFTYFTAEGSTNFYPNNLGTNSWHAEGVGNFFYGVPNGVATNIAHVDNFDADYFINNYIVSNLTVPDDPVVNQSFTFGALDATDQQSIDSAYDDYAETFGTFFVSAACNANISAKVCPPGTSYNCISVGAYADSTWYNSIGPTIDNGRCKPDITAPAGATSDSTPQVAGAVALLMQAGLRGDGGSDTNSAFDMRTIKALLLNGAIKPADWTNSNFSPLDARYGAGMVNVFNAYEQLAGGKHGCIISTTNAVDGAHPPAGGGSAVSVLSGWDFRTNSSGANFDGVNHYYFNVTNALGSAPFTATATLVWNRQFGETNINNLDLFLYDVISSNLVACSTSLVDNVEHIFMPQLPQGRYDLQVLKHGGTNTVSDAETYALAFEFFSLSLSVGPSGRNSVLSWPIYPAGFIVESTTDLIPPVVWSTNQISPPVVADNQNYILFTATNANRFFRLRRPDF